MSRPIGMLAALLATNGYDLPAVAIYRAGKSGRYHAGRCNNRGGAALRGIPPTTINKIPDRLVCGCVIQRTANELRNDSDIRPLLELYTRLPVTSISAHAAIHAKMQARTVLQDAAIALRSLDSTPVAVATAVAVAELLTPEIAKLDSQLSDAAECLVGQMAAWVSHQRSNIDRLNNRQTMGLASLERDLEVLIGGTRESFIGTCWERYKLTRLDQLTNLPVDRAQAALNGASNTHAATTVAWHDLVTDEAGNLWDAAHALHARMTEPATRWVIVNAVSGPSASQPRNNVFNPWLALTARRLNNRAVVKTSPAIASALRSEYKACPVIDALDGDTDEIAAIALGLLASEPTDWTGDPRATEVVQRAFDGARLV